MIPNSTQKAAPRNSRELLTIPEVAAELGSSRRFIEQEANRGRIRVIRLSARLVRVRRDDLDKYLSANASIHAFPNPPPGKASPEGKKGRMTR